jgi:dolichol-phosphate mannosyltransferase
LDILSLEGVRLATVLQAPLRRACAGIAATEEGDASAVDSGQSPWICVPTLNERDNVGLLLDSIFTVMDAANVVFVDDGSPDGTGELLDEYAAADPRVHVIHRPSTSGLASAYTTGFKYALSAGAEVVVQMDADLSHDPRELPCLLAAMRTADVAVGSRYVVGGVADWSWTRRLISRVGSLYARFMLGVPVRDLTGRYKCFRRSALVELTRQPPTIAGHGFQAELTYRAMRAGYRVAELPITFRERWAGRSKMSMGIVAEALLRIPALRLCGRGAPAAGSKGRIRRWAKFFAVGLVGAVTGYGALIVMVEVLHWSPHLAFLLSSIVSFETNFLLNDRLTWRDRGLGRETRLRRRVRFHLGRWATYPPAQLLFSLLVLHGVPYIAASVAAIALTSMLNYVISDRWVFARRPDAGAAVADAARPSTDLPPVSVVIPVRDSATTLRRAVFSVLEQDYRGTVEVIVVGSPGESSWAAIDDQIEAGAVRAYEIEVDAAGRDTCAKRTLGFTRASGQVLCSVDSDTMLPQGWIRHAVELIAAGWDGVAGPFASVGTDYWGTYVDRNVFGSKTPRMDIPYVFDAGTLTSAGQKPPVTGCAAFTAEVFETVGGFDKDFVYHYDDYDFFERVAEHGFRMLCTPELRITVQHRSSLAGLVKEYWESGAGCAQFVRKFPRSRLSRTRLRQLIAVAGGWVLLGFFPIEVAAAGAAGCALLGALSVLRTRMRGAFGYPLVTFLLGMVFASALAYHLVANGAHQRRTRIGRSWQVGHVTRLQ